MDELRNPLIEALVAERRRQKLTQGQLAEAAGISRRAVNLIEAGGDCTLGTLQRLYEAVGLQASASRQRMTLHEVVRESEAEMFERPPSPGSSS